MKEKCPKCNNFCLFYCPVLPSFIIYYYYLKGLKVILEKYYISNICKIIYQDTFISEKHTFYINRKHLKAHCLYISIMF